MSWVRFQLVIVAFYFFTNILFAAGYLLCGSGALEGTSAQTAGERFLEDFFFSVQTLASGNVLTSKRYSGTMAGMASTVKRATVYMESDLHRVLKVKAAETDRSLSDLINEAVRISLREDVEDLAAFEERAKEPNLRFEHVLKDLRRRGRL